MIEFDHVTFQYEKALTPALTNIDLTIDKGEFVAIVGHNGSGKSTLAKHVNGLLLPTEGTVTVCGMQTSNEDDLLRIRQKVGMAFQNPDNQLVTTVVEEDVAFGPENLGIEPNEIRTRVDKALASVGMSDYATFAVHHLSGGQKQRIAIAGILALKPQILVLDEASAMLDPNGRAELLETVHKLHREGMTVLMVTQYMEETTGCDRIIVMNHGKIVLEGTPEEVFRHTDLLMESNLVPPETVSVRDALRSMGYALKDRSLTAEQLAEELCPLL
ncbi:MAG: energy-coupling factor transporter ATPase [Clostridia bacterium]|nr:energy-coupling factor transporter ATPase [Clostridia bacterium]